MLRSMTGFARARAGNQACEAVVELRSVNHRYLDVRMRMGASLSGFEKRIRDRVGAELNRGRVDVSIYLEPLGESASAIEVDRPLMREFVLQAKDLARELGVSGELRPSDLVGFTPAFTVRERELSDGAGVWEAVEKALGSALDSLRRMREAEGAEMAADLNARLRLLEEHLIRIESISQKSRESRRKELQGRVEDLVASAAEPSVIAMEVTRAVERSDVAEEIVRFRSHVELWRATTSSEGACGKKLDFIVQEMNREVNTIGSKCQDARVAERVIEMKTELERMREQVQNVE